MKSATARLGALLAAWGLCCACSEVGAPAAPAEPFHLVVITVDTLRAGHLGCYGHFRDTSPFLDAFAADALVFESCVVPMSTTLPSHVSLFTSTYPLEHGVVANVKANGRRFRPVPGLATLAQILSEAGFDTAGFVSCTPLKEKSGIDAGFQTFDVPQAGQRRAPATNRAVFDWLETRGEEPRPFFLWTHYYDPHSPYDAPEPHGSLFQGDAARAAYLADAGFPEVVTDVQGKRLRVPETLDAYDGEVHFTDAAIGRLFQRLKDLGLWDKTVILVTADHGESLGQHGEAGHGGIWQEQLRVPLILRVPGLEPGRVAAPLSSVDILPTLFALTELPGGARLSAQASGRDALAEGPEAPLLSVTNARHLAPGVTAEYGLVEDGWKYVLRAGADDLLFDLTSDPFELEDRLAVEPERAAHLRTALVAAIEAQTQRAVQLGAGGDGADAADELEELRALGYL